MCATSMGIGDPMTMCVSVWVQGFVILFPCQVLLVPSVVQLWT